MKIRTNDLKDKALDWAVAKCEGWDAPIFRNRTWAVPLYVATNGTGLHTYAPSTDWAQGGPIIERERISIRQWTNVPLVHAYMPQDNAPWLSDGTSPLIAAMRCYCSFKLGDEVDVPEELM